jgi:isopenicillin-N epimerase
MAGPLAKHWTLDPGVSFLNHGSFGACPRVVLERQREIRDEIERQPVRFFAGELNDRLDAARCKLGAFLGAEPEGLVAVSNATGGVNAVLRSLRFGPDDELLVTDHAYNACRNALDFVAGRSGATVVEVPVPFPGATPEGVERSILDAVTPRTRLALIDHVTSPTGMILPVETLVRRLDALGVDTLIDGAHAPGMLPLDLARLGSAYYTGNCHKWLCAPKGAGFLYVREDRRDAIVPLTISHGANSPRPGRSRFHDLFDWQGTVDPTAFLCVPAAIEFIGSLLPGGWPEVTRRNRALALAGRETLRAALDIDEPCPDSMVGSIASVPLPDGSGDPPRSALYLDPLHAALLEEHGIEVPIVPWPAHPRRLVRISAQLYNSEDEYARLAGALRRALRTA